MTERFGLGLAFRPRGRPRKKSPQQWFLTPFSPTIDDSPAGNDSLTVNVPVDSSLVFADMPGGYNCVVSGTGSLVKTGPGVLWLTGAGTYDGQTIIDNGTLALGGIQRVGRHRGRAAHNFDRNPRRRGCQH